jgi:FixJ family two-component response regulator
MPKNKTYIALVDDDESFARALGRFLRASGFEAQTYSSGEAFLNRTTLPQPDCLVFDIQLGGMSGVDLLHRLRESGTATPVIFVTAHDTDQVRDDAERAGCVAYLRKPVAGHVLLEAVAKALG